MTGKRLGSLLILACVGSLLGDPLATGASTLVLHSNTARATTLVGSGTASTEVSITPPEDLIPLEHLILVFEIPLQPLELLPLPARPIHPRRHLF